MAFALSDIRTDLDAALATAVDSSTWTTAIKDEAARQAVKEYDEQIVYETTFTAIAAGYEHNLSTITGIKDIKAIAWPWSSSGEDFTRRMVPWRYITDQTIFVDTYHRGGQPAIGDLIRVRHTKLHTLNGLDSAVATTIPDRHRYALGLLAAAHACTLRIRQISENPALPGAAPQLLSRLATEFRDEADRRLQNAQTGHNPAWSDIGL